MAGYIQAALRSLPIASGRTAGASAPPRIERLSFELFGNLDGDGEPDMPGERSVPPGSVEGQGPAAESHATPVSSATFNSFAAAAAYDASLRRPEHVPPEGREPAEAADATRGHAVYARRAGIDGAEARRYPGSLLDYRF